MKPGKPVQSALAQSRDLGPISVRKVLRTQIVTVGGADLVGELSDETRFRKFVGLHLPPLRRIVGDALFTAEDDEPNWQLAHDILAPAFTREAMSGYHATMLQVARELLARWDARRRPRTTRRRHPRHDAVDHGDHRAGRVRLPVRLFRPRPSRIRSSSR